MRHFLHELFFPRSIAVIGASRKAGKIGNIIVKNLVESGYCGEIYPLNPREKEILGLKSYESLQELPSWKKREEPPDVAVVAVPAKHVMKAARDCASVGVKFLVVISAGFKETGTEGMKLEKELDAFCREHKIRVMGPNCVGLMHTHTPVNASFSRGFSEKGNIAFISQSGAILTSILDWSKARNLGFSYLVSVGNKMDLHELDFLEYAAWDPATSVVLCYLEDVVDGERFLEVAERVARIKPVVVIKSGSSPAGARAATSHTGALAGADRAYSAAFKKSAVLRVEGMEELFDMAAAFAAQPHPEGDRIAIITNSGGPGILCTDQLEKKGLQMARFSPETIERLRSSLPAEASLYNPVDLLGDAGPDRYKEALESALLDPGVSGVIFLLCPTATTSAGEVAAGIKETRERLPRKPVLAVLMGGLAIEGGKVALQEENIPCFTFPERAVNAMKGMVDYSLSSRAKKLAAEEQIKLPRDVNRYLVNDILQEVLQERRVVLLEHETMEILNAYRVIAAPTRLASEPREAVQMAEEIGFPVVLKIASPKIPHKSDAGGVEIGLENGEQVSRGFEEIMQRVQRFSPDAPLYGIEVQKMMPSGAEVIIGISNDIHFGPLLIFGLGGIYVNLLEDISYRLTKDLTEKEVEEMIKETKAYRLLRGFRQSRPLDITSLKETILKVAALANDFPQIQEMDINPMLVYESGVRAVDAKITLSHHFISSGPKSEESPHDPKKEVKKH